jgi:hypothetical protein
MRPQRLGGRGKDNPSETKLSSKAKELYLDIFSSKLLPLATYTFLNSYLF